MTRVKGNKNLNIMVLTLIVLTCSLNQALYSQEILNVIENFVLVNLDESSGHQLNDEIEVFRTMSEGERVMTGKIRLTEFRENRCVAEIVENYSTYKISIGDFIPKKKKAIIDDLFSTPAKTIESTPAEPVATPQPPVQQVQQPVEEEPLQEVAFEQPVQQQVRQEETPQQVYTRPVYKPPANKKLSYYLIGAGAVAGGVALYFNGKANSTYDDYEDANSADDAEDFYDETVGYDKISQISMIAGGGLIAFGIVKLILANPGSSRYSENRIHLEPVQKRHYQGLALNIPLGKQ